MGLLYQPLAVPVVRCGSLVVCDCRIFGCPRLRLESPDRGEVGAGECECLLFVAAQAAEVLIGEEDGVLPDDPLGGA